ncbi:histidine phosphatase family protein [Roseibacterium sp. SDUM158016]|uniref:histidine phosphatase family protein n=1 Tax=Roseicyclus sediminis TaxID=2980997 RepID=UPI0021D05A1A|nr:histidine phosphatase family protein [Roseibacterium sp. SDUM158016]MCU4655021.1 histidine phosphatase family protein [Roseibacterium sp. SDUM158016]
MFRRSFLLCGTASVAACQLADPTTVRGGVSLSPGTTLIVLRHAERDDEALSRQGHNRAQALVAALEGVPVDAIYTRDIPRNLETAAPLARARGLPVSVIAAENPASELARLGAGRTVVWVGNRDNLADIWTALDAPGEAPVVYGELFFVSAGRPPQVDRRRFGA